MLIIAASSAAAETIAAAATSVDVGAVPQSLLGAVSYQLEAPPFPDQARRLAPAHEPNELALDTFTPLGSQALNFGYTARRVWVYLRLRNSADQPVSRYILTGQRYMRPLIVYERGADGRFHEVLYNDQYQAFSSRPVHLPTLVLPLEFAPHEEKDLLIYTGAAGSLALNLGLHDPDVVHEANVRSLITLMFMEGLLVALIVINLFHYVALRRKIYVVYAALQTMIGLFLLHMDGYGFQYLWPEWIWFNAKATLILGHGTNLAAVLFAIGYLGLQHGSRKLFYPAVATALVSATFLVATPVIDARLSNQVGTFMTSLAPIAFVGLGLYLFWRGNRSAIYFVFAWLALGGGTFLFGASVTGMLNLPLISVDWIRLGAIGDAILLSIGLADQIRRLNRDYDVTRNRLVANLEQRLSETQERIALEEDNVRQTHELIALDRRLATTSHDISQPVHALRLSLLALSSRLREPQLMETLNRTLDSMEDVLADNLDGAEHHVTQNLPDTLGGMNVQVVDMYREQALQAGCDLCSTVSTVSLPPGALVPLRRIVQNLVSNAIKHARCTRILIGVRRGARPALWVVDNGQGLPQDIAEHSTTRGHGLGLTIIDEICADHGWQFSLDSRPGHGVTCAITL